MHSWPQGDFRGGQAPLPPSTSAATGQDQEQALWLDARYDAKYK